jgi:hypothetical protein
LNRKRLKNFALRNYTKVKDLSDILAPKYKRYFGHKTEIYDKKGNLKIIAVSQPDITESKIFSRKKKRAKKKVWITVLKKRLRYGNLFEASFNKKTKQFCFTFWYKTTALFVYLTSEELFSISNYYKKQSKTTLR